MLKEECPERGERKENSSRASTTEVNRLFLRHNTQTRGGVLVRFRFVCLFVFSSSLPAVSVVSSSRGSKPLTPRRYLGTEENRGWEGARSRGEEKWEQTDGVSVASASAMREKKKRKKQTKKTKTRMRYVTNAAADGEDGEQLGRENAMSRLIRLIGNLGAADFQGFVFFLRWSVPKPRSVTKGALAARKQINK